MASIFRSAVTWPIALRMPFQVLTAVCLDMRGPAHFHAGSEHRHEYGHEHQGHLHSHGPGQVERHHHHPDDFSVVTVHNSPLLESLALEAETKSGWSGVMLV